MKKIEIRIKGKLDKDWTDWFSSLNIAHTPYGETVLVGPIRDQAELRGVLCRLTDLGLELIYLNASTQSPGVSAKSRREGGD
jgi:hypothetical protein